MARLTGRERGVATVEMALVLPLLLLLTFGLIEYGWMFLKAQQTAAAARHGARQAILPSATNARVLSAVADQMADAGITGDYTVTFVPADVAAVVPGEAVTVSVSVPYEGANDLGMPFVPVPGKLDASSSMAKEGP